MSDVCRVKEQKSKVPTLQNVQLNECKLQGRHQKVRTGNSLFSFLRNEWFAQKSKWFAHSLIFGEQPEWFTHCHSFLVRNLSESLIVAHFWRGTRAIRLHGSILVRDLSYLLTSLIKKEGISELLVSKKTYKKRTQNTILVKFVCDLSKSLTVAYLSKAT